MIAEYYLRLRTELENALASLLQLVSELERDSIMLETIKGLIRDAREPFLFVVVGEVKAGKSSLLNALFGQEFCRVDLLPATDRVYIFKYGTDEQSVDVSPQLTERYQPIDFLRDFNVVDTPGTNTMVAEHQTITENFIPRADLVLFIFSVINPWAASAWELLRFVQKKWLKNVVFVLQQADLREPNEVAIIHRHLEDTANEKLGFAPPLFAVSARKALLSRTNGLDKERLWQESNFGQLEDHISMMVSRERTRMLKLASTCQTASLILSDSAQRIRRCLGTIVRDETQLAGLQSTLEARKDQTLRQIAGFLRGIEQASRVCEDQGEQMLQHQLSFWRTWRLVFGKAEWQHEFQAELETKMRNQIQPQLENALQLLETDLRGLWPQLQNTMESKFAAESKVHLNQTIPDFARQRRELLQSVQLALVERVGGKEMEEQLERMFRETGSWLRLPAGLAAAGGIVAFIAAMSSAAVADVTGIVAASAAVIGTFIAFGRRRKILAEYRRQMESKRTELSHAIDQHLQHAIDLFYSEIRVVFQPLEAFCASERRRYDPLLKRVEELERRFAQLMRQIAKG
jgi:ribosome biogenesis GTPase A